MSSRNILSILGIALTFSLGRALVVAAESPIASGLVLHFDAQDLNDGGPNPAAGAITSWADVSGNNLDLSTANGSGSNKGGVYNTGAAAINGQNFVFFDDAGANQWMQTANIAATTLATGGNQASTFHVIDFNAGVVYAKWEAGGDNRYGWEGSNRWDFATDDAGLGQLSGWSSTLNGNFQILTGLATPGAGNRQVFLNGNLVSTGAVHNTITGTSGYALGAGPGGANTADVSFAEVLHFNRKLNVAEHQIVENNLSSKYNLAVANDRYAGDSLGNGHFDFGVFGIGRVDASNVSATTPNVDGLAITATGGLGDNEFVMAGHKVPTNGSTPFGTGERWTREWFVDATNSNVDLQLAFDWATDNLASTDALDSYELLWRPSEASSYTVLASGGLVSGNNVLFNVNSTLIHNGLITLGINTFPAPSTIVIWSSLGVCGLIFGWRQRRHFWR